MSATFTQLTIRRGLTRTVIASVFLASAVVVWGGYTGHWSWTGLTQNGTLWDWLKLLVLPLSLAALPLWLQSHQQMSVIRRWILAAVAPLRDVAEDSHYPQSGDVSRYVLKYFASGWCTTMASVDCSGCS